MKKVRSITFDKDYNATVEEVTFKDEKKPSSSKLSPIFYSLAPFAFTIVIFALAVFIGISVGILSIPHITDVVLSNTTAVMDTGVHPMTVCLMFVPIVLLFGGIWHYGMIPKEVKKE